MTPAHKLIVEEWQKYYGMDYSYEPIKRNPDNASNIDYGGSFKIPWSEVVEHTCSAGEPRLYNLEHFQIWIHRCLMPVGQTRCYKFLEIKVIPRS